MTKKDELIRKLNDMTKETAAGRLKWKLTGQTTEYNDSSSKPQTEEDGRLWTVDECYISYECQYKGQDFVMITYEMIHNSEGESNSTNLVFLPPLGIRFFDINTLLPYAVEADKMLIFEIHNLWLMLLELAKKHSDNVELDMSPRELTID